MRQENVFYWAMAPLVIFYAFFAAVLLPNVGSLHPLDKVASWLAALPESLACFVKVSLCRFT
jgi:ATP/ADP translocase